MMLDMLGHQARSLQGSGRCVRDPRRVGMTTIIISYENETYLPPFHDIGVLCDIFFDFLEITSHFCPTCFCTGSVLE